MSTAGFYPRLLSTTRLLVILMRRRTDARVAAVAWRLTGSLERLLEDAGRTMPDWPARLDAAQRADLTNAYIELLTTSRIATGMRNAPIALSHELADAFHFDLGREAAWAHQLYGT